MMQRYVTLKNDFHNTQARVLVSALAGGAIGASEDGHDGYGYLSTQQIKRVKRALCPNKAGGCACSGKLGTRGPQEVGIEQGFEHVRLYREDPDRVYGMTAKDAIRDAGDPDQWYTGQRSGA